VKPLLSNLILNESVGPICFDRNLSKTAGGRMKNLRNTAQQLFGLTLTLVGLLSWHILPIAQPELSVRAANRVRGAEPTGQTVSRAVANGRVAFVSSEGYEQSDIYTMNPDGSDRKQLTFSQDHEDHLAWSPDGTKIAFARFTHTPFREIFVMNADGSDQRRLTQSKFDLYPTWSPDGTKIAFYRLDSITKDGMTMLPHLGIFVMNADGSDQRAVASTVGFMEPAWSPDGLKFAAGTLGPYGIYLINVDGSNPTQITQPPTPSDVFEDHIPAWSPDGSKITFARCVDSNGFGCYTTSHLWGVNADGSNPTKLTDTLAYTHAWSPDGTKIIFGSVNDSLEPRDLFVMNPDGSGLTNITNTDGKWEWSPSWQPLSLPAVVNPIDDAQFFVRQHYLDFLNREPDAAGLAFWTNEITSCGADTQCVAVKRQHVSAAFFLSIEFQQTGFLVYKTFAAAFGATRVGSTVPLTLAEFLPDVQRVSQGVVVGTAGWEAQLAANQTAYFNEFVSHPAFVSAYPTTLTSAQFVDALNQNAGGALSAAERDQLAAELMAGAKTRAEVLRAVAEDVDFTSAQFNRAFVLIQYFGYLRRNAHDSPDNNFDGYNFWLAKLDQFNGNSIAAQMVKAFIISSEYRQRFGP
jgi:Tol biopolymer transport system component